MHRAVQLAVLALLLALSGCVVATQRPPPDQGDSGGSGGSENASQNGYSFLHTRDGEPVRWSTCEPIRYVVRSDNAPEGASALLEESIARISEVTGLEFSDEGETSEAPSTDRELYQPDRYGDQWAPVLISYSSPDEYEPLSGQAAGYGGAALVQPGSGTPRYVSGTAVFDIEQLEQFGEEGTRAVMLHELAHVVGLGHVDDRSQLMNPVQYAREVTTLQDGDIAGLEALGNGECYDPVDPSQLRSR